MDKQYSYIISFGSMCSTALFLREHGYRSCTTIFDWFDSTFMNNIFLWENNFDGLLKKEYLKQLYSENPHIITNVKYGINMPHLFDDRTSFDRQIKSISNYVADKIEAFNRCLESKNVLLVSYLRKDEEIEWVKNNTSKIDDICKKYSVDFIFITNREIDRDFKYMNFFIPANNIHKPFGGPVSYPFEQTEEIVEFLNNHYSNEIILKNKKHKIKKKNIIKRIYRKLFKKKVRLSI